MSFRAWSREGFGIDTTEIHWKDLSLENIKKFVDGTNFGKELLREINNEPEDDYLEVIEQCAEDWGNIYNSGIEFVIASVINEKEELDIEVFDCDDYDCSYVCLTPFYPFIEHEQGKLRSINWYEDMFKRYFSCFTDDKIEASYQVAYYSG